MKAFLVGRYELATMLRKPAFVIIAFVLPLLGVGILAAVTLVRSGSEAEQPAEPAPEEIKPEGFVDLSGIIQQLPEDLPAGMLVEYPNESEAGRALQDGDITAYYLVASDYLTSGNVEYIHPTVNPLSSNGQDWLIRRALVFNLVGDDASLLDQIWSPINTESVDLAAAEQGASGDCARPNANCESNELVRLIPTFLMIFLFVAMTNGSALLMRNVSLEKQNRMIEILTSSLSPMQIMAGKVAGLGAASLLAFGVWVVSAAIAIRLGNTAAFFPAGFSIPGDLLPWTVTFFLLGFALYGSLAAGLGALVPNLKESTQAGWLLMAPLLLGYMIGLFGIEQPHSAVMLLLSLIPLSSPMVMVQRLSVGGVPAWQPIVSLLILALSVFGAIWAAARLFRAQNLLSGQHFSLRRLVSSLTA